MNVKIELECPKGYEERVIAYVNEAIKIAVREDETKKVQPDVDEAVETILTDLALAKIDGVAVVAEEEPIKEPIKE